MPAFSIGKQRRQCKRQNYQGTFQKAPDTPGVGAYNTATWAKNSKVRNNPSASIGREERQVVKEGSSPEKVGPGTYETQKPYSSVGPSLKGRTIENHQAQTPSPAQYQIDNKIFPSKQYSFGKGRRKFKIDKFPGPGTYQIHDLNKTCVNTFQKSPRERENSEKKIIPGPGKYEYCPEKHLKSNPEFSFTHKKKFKEDQEELSIKQKMPGPGAYDSNKSQKVFRGGKFSQAEKTATYSFSKLQPGPGSYNTTDTQFYQTAKCKFGESSRMSTEKAFTPGPAHYKAVDIDRTKKSHGKMKFGTSQRRMLTQSATPGPGAYKNISQFQNKKGLSFSSSRNLSQKKAPIPSPQEYHPNYKLTEKSGERIIIGKEEKFKKLKTEHPGPASYELVRKNPCKSFFFSRSNRHEKLNASVGPGQYKIKPYFGICDGLSKEEKDILYV